MWFLSSSLLSRAAIVSTVVQSAGLSSPLQLIEWEFVEYKALLKC